MSDKLIKFLVVVFLTLLIWTWAFLSLGKSETFSGSLEVSPASDPSFLVSFVVDGDDRGREVPLRLQFKGVPAKITELLSRTEWVAPGNPKKERLNYQYDPREYGHTEKKLYPFYLLDFLQQNSKTKELALTLEKCFIDQKSVEWIEVNIEVLQKKPLSVVCLKENGIEIEGAVIEPARVEMYVQDNYNKPAYVTLSAQQIEWARQNEKPVRAKPYVEMASERREVSEPVSVTLQKTSLLELESKPFQTTKPIGIIMSQDIQNAYKVIIENDGEIRSRIQISATNQAFDA